jgi:hypothetical protein
MFPYLHLSLFNVLFRIEEAIRSKYSTRDAMELIRALQARAPAQDQQGPKGWWKEQTTAVLSSIKLPLEVNDVEMFVSIAESEGVLFFSETCVLADGWNDSSV